MCQLVKNSRKLQPRHFPSTRALHSFFCLCAVWLSICTVILSDSLGCMSHLFQVMRPPYSFVVKVKNGFYLLNLINASDITGQNVISEISCFWLSGTSCLIGLRSLLFIINMKTNWVTISDFYIKLWSLRDNWIQPFYFYRKESRINDLPEIRQIKTRTPISEFIFTAQMSNNCFFALRLFTSAQDQNVFIFRGKKKERSTSTRHSMSHCWIVSLEEWLESFFTLQGRGQKNDFRVKQSKAKQAPCCVSCDKAGTVVENDLCFTSCVCEDFNSAPSISLHRPISNITWQVGIFFFSTGWDVEIV